MQDAVSDAGRGSRCTDGGGAGFLRLLRLTAAQARWVPADAEEGALWGAKPSVASYAAQRGEHFAHLERFPDPR